MIKIVLKSLGCGLLAGFAAFLLIIGLFWFIFLGELSIYDKTMVFICARLFSCVVFGCVTYVNAMCLLSDYS